MSQYKLYFVVKKDKNLRILIKNPHIFKEIIKMSVFKCICLILNIYIPLFLSKNRLIWHQNWLNFLIPFCLIISWGLGGTLVTVSGVPFWWCNGGVPVLNIVKLRKLIHLGHTWVPFSNFQIFIKFYFYIHNRNINDVTIKIHFNQIIFRAEVTTLKT